MLLFCVASVYIYSNIIALYEDKFNIKYRSVMLDCRGRLDYLKKCMYDKSPQRDFDLPCHRLNNVYSHHHHLPLYIIYICIYT